MIDHPALREENHNDEEDVSTKQTNEKPPEGG
jgi:hypothetical protein